MEELLDPVGGGPPARDAATGDEASSGTAFCAVVGHDDRKIEARREPGEVPGEQIWVIQESVSARSKEREFLEMSRALHAARLELADLRDRVAREAAEREELLTVVSHELRTPVTVISGYNRLLLSEDVGPLAPEQRRFLRESAKSCKRLDTFIGNLMEASREARGKLRLDLRERSLEPVVLGATGFLRPLLDERGLRLELDLDPGALHARFDTTAVDQVLTNLIGNAIRYAKAEGIVSVSTRLETRDGQEFVIVGVCDDGPGVAHDDQQRIFEAYVRAGDDRQAGALGLGLAICKRIVEAHGGVIGVRSQDGGGSCFEFSLPRAGSGDWSTEATSDA
jgi:signal transduction histidine kinase